MDLALVLWKLVHNEVKVPAVLECDESISVEVNEDTILVVIGELSKSFLINRLPAATNE